MVNWSSIMHPTSIRIVCGLNFSQSDSRVFFGYALQFPTFIKMDSLVIVNPNKSLVLSNELINVELPP